MTHIRLTEHFEAPIERVFELGIDFKRYPEWNTFFSEVREVKGLPDKVGTKVLDTMKILGRPIEGTTEIVEIEKPRMIKLLGTGQAGGFTRTTYRFTPTGLGTDVEIEIEYELPSAIVTLFDKVFIEKSVQRELHHSLENFKAFVELKTPALV